MIIQLLTEELTKHIRQNYSLTSDNLEKHWSNHPEETFNF